MVDRFPTSLGTPGGVGTTGVAPIEIINTSTTKSAKIRRISCFLLAATATQLGVGYPAAAGITPTTPIFLKDQKGGSGPGLKTAIAWATPPTVPAAFLRVGDAAAAIGNAIVFDFGDAGVLLAPLQTLVVWNRNTNSVLNATVEAVEQTTVVVNS